MTASAASSGYLIDKILPTNRIHLFAGISSVGKSRFIIPAFLMWQTGMPVLGLKSHPVPWCVVSADRPLQDAVDSITSLGFNPEDVNIIPAFGAHNKSALQVMQAAEKLGAKLIIWEGFDFMVRNSNSTGEVRDFLSLMSSYCEDGLTILGTVGVAKLKPHEMYHNPRQLVAGSSLWERATSTNFICVPVNPKDIADPRRLLHVSLKNSASFTVAGEFDQNGVLCFDDWDKVRGKDWLSTLNNSEGKFYGK